MREEPFDLQHEIDTSADGDTIWVEPGTYYGNFDFRGKAVVVKSTAGPDSTVLDANWWGSVVTFKSGEDTSSVLDGFTLTHGIGTGPWDNRDGGGIYCINSSSKIINNIITGNRTTEGDVVENNDGGGLYISGGDYFILRDNVVSHNFASLGGGMRIDDSSGEIVGNRILHNEDFGHGVSGGGRGGGICVGQVEPGDYSVLIKGNLFAYNEAGNFKWRSVGGALWIGSITIDVVENFFLGNTASCGGAISMDGNGSFRILRNIFRENVALGWGAGEVPYGGWGGAIFQNFTSYSVQIWGNTFYDNIARRYIGDIGYGGAIYNYGYQGEIVNNLIVMNTNGGVYTDESGIVIHHNDVWQNTNGDYQGEAFPGEGDISVNPQLDEKGKYCYTLKPTSPCIDAGIDLGYDYCGQAPDMGAWEYDFEGSCPRRMKMFLLEMMEDMPDSVK